MNADAVWRGEHAMDQSPEQEKENLKLKRETTTHERKRRKERCGPMGNKTKEKVCRTKINADAREETRSEHILHHA